MTGWTRAFLVAVSLAATPAVAQPSTMVESEVFLKAVREEDGDKVIQMVQSKGQHLINIRGYDGTTPLTLAVQKRATLYLNFFLQNRADPNIAEKSGDTPLMIAARSGWMEGINTLLNAKARVDATNRVGETALILAVQSRQPAAVKRLLEAGANPDKADHAAGLSARDYAKRDRRNVDLLRVIETTKSKAKSAVGPSLL